LRSVYDIYMVEIGCYRYEYGKGQMKQIYKTLIAVFIILISAIGTCNAYPTIQHTIGTDISTDTNSFNGNWENVNTNTPGITKMDIQSSGKNVYVHIWGSCHPEDCDWGVVEARYERGTLVTMYQFDFGKTINICTLLDSNTMYVNSSTTYKENDIYGRTYQQYVDYLKKTNMYTPTPTPVPYTPAPYVIATPLPLVTATSALATPAPMKMPTFNIVTPIFAIMVGIGAVIYVFKKTR